jgi:hypothetical protein
VSNQNTDHNFSNLSPFKIYSLQLIIVTAAGIIMIIIAVTIITIAIAIVDGGSVAAIADVTEELIT